MIGAGVSAPLGICLIGGKYIFNYSVFENFYSPEGYNGGAIMFQKEYSATVVMSYTTFTNISVKVCSINL